VFGGAPIAGLYAPVSAEQAAATLEAAWAAGVRRFDTAPHYGAGLSEQRIGRFLAGRSRPGCTVSTKVGRRLVPPAGDVEGVGGFYGTPDRLRGLPGGDRLVGVRHLVQDEPDPNWLGRPAAVFGGTAVTAYRLKVPG
jgi:hypothetical protein